MIYLLWMTFWRELSWRQHERPTERRPTFEKSGLAAPRSPAGGNRAGLADALVYRHIAEPLFWAVRSSGASQGEESG